MDTHKYPEWVKVQRSCLTLVGETRLWYELFRLINVDWIGVTSGSSTYTHCYYICLN